ncbi:hypothetical protein [Allorhodopirellula heiligendammensis]|uniref:Uncharacterized protein n=1 Tax=Allorhodopirellula heiligendammensis TaxID=2714739 RepID=A0A5C6C5I9_9BACT|nr:hypothetical protein [Allorhodopirellula heiligendammensis]TWU18746.1 hypothetical protein Poly21_09120 [Allorhodopirellula heiligendammensis]
MRSSTQTLVIFSLCLFTVGCGGREVQSPQAGELERYLQENPEAAARGGQKEPEGLSGPAELPGTGSR